MTTTMRTWVAGMISAAMGGASGVFAIMIADPQNFDLDHWAKILKVAVIVSATHVVAYLAKSPLPELSTVTTSVSAPGPAGSIVTVKETHTEPVNDAGPKINP